MGNLFIFEEKWVIHRQSPRKSNYQHGGEEGKGSKASWHTYTNDVTRRRGTGGPLILVLLPNFVPPSLIVVDVPETRHEG